MGRAVVTPWQLIYTPKELLLILFQLFVIFQCCKVIYIANPLGWWPLVTPWGGDVPHAPVIGAGYTCSHLWLSAPACLDYLSCIFYIVCITVLLYFINSDIDRSTKLPHRFLMGETFLLHYFYVLWAGPVFSTSLSCALIVGAFTAPVKLKKWADIVPCRAQWHSVMFIGGLPHPCLLCILTFTLSIYVMYSHYAITWALRQYRLLCYNTHCVNSVVIKQTWIFLHNYSMRLFYQTLNF